MNKTSVQKFQDVGWSEPLEEWGFAKKMVAAWLSEKSVLDVGCGDGFLLEHLREQNPQRIFKGLDISPKALALCQAKGLDCQAVDISEPWPLPDNSFEAVLLLDVLEHFWQPEFVLAEAKRVASRAVYISVPNFSSLPARWQVLVGGVPENNTARKGHSYWFNRDVLSQMIGRAGLEVEKEAVNTFWESKLIFGRLMKILKKIQPKIFALSFVLKLKIND